jgi:hypothetical protein
MVAPIQIEAELGLPMASLTDYHLELVDDKPVYIELLVYLYA